MKNESKIGVGIALGCGIGAAIGVATDNLGLWIAVGIAIGAGIGTSLTKKGNKKMIANLEIIENKSS